MLTIVGGVVMFLFGMESGGVTHPWDSAFTLCLIIFGVVTIVLVSVLVPSMPRALSAWDSILTSRVQLILLSSSHLSPVDPS